MARHANSRIRLAILREAWFASICSGLLIQISMLEHVGRRYSVVLRQETSLANFCIVQRSSKLHAVRVCQCYSPIIFKECCTHLTHQYTSHRTSCNITIDVCMASPLVAMQDFPSPCELQLFKPRQSQLASWICSVRAVAFAFEFQASDGSEEQALKSPFEAAVRIKAGCLLNGFTNLSLYFLESWRQDLS